MLPNVQRTDAADHVPVLAEEVRELLDVQPGETVVDATFGAGGHSRLLVGELEGSGKLIAIDRDPTVRAYLDRVKAQARGVQVRFLRGDYAVVLSQLAGNGVRADAVLLDLGLSSMQVDRPERGFSVRDRCPARHAHGPVGGVECRGCGRDADREGAREDLPHATARSGTRARSRAGSCVVAPSLRSSAPGSSSTSCAARFRLPRGSARAIPRSACSRRFASRSTTSSSRSRPGFRQRWRCCGRAGGWRSSASTRSRIGSSKRFLRDRARGCTCPPEFPVCVCGREPELRILTSKPIRPSAREIDLNARAASARLRVATKV